MANIEAEAQQVELVEKENFEQAEKLSLKVEDNKRDISALKKKILVRL